MKLEALKKSQYYHIYNRGINGGTIFKNDENMFYFLALVKKYLANKITILSYCLLKNHYHFLVRIDVDSKTATHSFSNLFNAYAKAFNKQQARTGSLFEKHFKRKNIRSEEYLKNIILYIHKNPEKHHLIPDFSKYTFSSYNEIINNNSEIVSVQEVVHLFDTIDDFIFSHQSAQIDEELNIQNSEYLTENKNRDDIYKRRERETHKGRRGGYKGNEEDTYIIGREEDIYRGKEEDTYKVFKTLQDVSGTLQDVSENSQKKTISYKNKFYKYIENLQDIITSTLEEIDGTAKFEEDTWERKEGGGGKTRVIENGNVFEKGGVNISAVHGELPEVLRNQFKVKEGNFFACGLSLVLHPKNPFIPTVHANWRYFEMYSETGEVVSQWFGGGQDLTPYYLFDEDAIHFHKTCKKACDRHHKDFYKKFKKTCDEYFWNSHRNEARGIGGLFFDYLKKTDTFSMEDRYNFVTEVGNSFLESYIPIVEKRKEIPYAATHKNWQEIRRGRYVEFNLVHDRGTLFGLKTNGRIESILMSLPPTVQWKYNHFPKENSEEEKLLKVLSKPKDWV